ncbi:uncharacterized protein LACBIDRAFT_321613 [Laccaria bicolor S238N-H82]|uniref:Predicted protein n=1 Tax=Laccaria bicolor (strain S238N-H82 / ATCC MYA-4686) TaxID=486041 RepID=B0CTJ3_LACBS|nr:uncharacterized protein LACBIDRAFT_321613 [Laccaria bicolor S238N-H82]EDR14499.1 predicted protein [Laccaria bicolor S238N-H82]|eukprot:XP_001875058.1 predicted protein [Laccaria bicolor S238N-H82]
MCTGGQLAAGKAQPSESVMASALLQLVVEDDVHVNFSTSQTRLSCQWDKMESYWQLKQKRLLLKRLKAKYSTPPRPWSRKLTLKNSPRACLWQAGEVQPP